MVYENKDCVVLILETFSDKGICFLGSLAIGD